MGNRGGTQRQRKRKIGELYHDGTCDRCGLSATEEGHDPCIANLPGVLNACCGHGLREGYVMFENGLVIRGRFDHLRKIILESEGRPMVMILNPDFYRSAEGGIVTRSNVERLLDDGAIKVLMRDGSWWAIRRNGVTKRWKKDPNRFHIPFKIGLRGYGAITEGDFVELNESRK